MDRVDKMDFLRKLFGLLGTAPFYVQKKTGCSNDSKSDVDWRGGGSLLRLKKLSKNLTRAVVISGALLITSAGYAAVGWVELGTSGTDTLYFDPSTVRRDGVSSRVWVMSNYDHPVKIRRYYFFSTPVWSSRELYEIDCANNRVRSLEQTGFSEKMVQGQIVASYTKPSAWHYVPPSSAITYLYRLICR